MAARPSSTKAVKTKKSCLNESPAVCRKTDNMDFYMVVDDWSNYLQNILFRQNIADLVILMKLQRFENSCITNICQTTI